MTPPTYDANRNALLEERERLLHQLEELGADETGNLTGAVDFGDAFADAGAATAARTRTLGLIENLAANVKDVDLALSRIADGTYGTCIVCGEAIPPERLEFRPTSVRCVSCKASAN